MTKTPNKCVVSDGDISTLDVDTFGSPTFMRSANVMFVSPQPAPAEIVIIHFEDAEGTKTTSLLTYEDMNALYLSMQPKTTKGAH